MIPPHDAPALHRLVREFLDNVGPVQQGAATLILLGELAKKVPTEARERFINELAATAKHQIAITDKDRHMTTWVTATPEQLLKISALENKWRQEAEGDPIVAMGAASELLMNAISRDVPPEHHAGAIEAVYNGLRAMLGDNQDLDLDRINKLIDQGRLVGTFDETGAPFHFMNSVSRHTGQPGVIIVWLQPEGVDDDLETPMDEG